jgi:hypothetical protein
MEKSVHNSFNEIWGEEILNKNTDIASASEDWPCYQYIDMWRSCTSTRGAFNNYYRTGYFVVFKLFIKKFKLF